MIRKRIQCRRIFLRYAERDKLDSQKVRIIFQTINRLPDDKEAAWEGSRRHRMESEAKGKYYEREGTHYCLYEEQPEGWDTPCKVMLKWKDAVLERHIRGESASHMVFEPGKCHCNFYHTLYGDLLLETETRRLEITEEQDTFLLVLEYGIRQDGQIISENRMEIHIQGTGKGI